MSLRRSAPIALRPKGISDAIDSTPVFPGAMMSLRDLIPDPSTRNLWQCRPAALEVADMGLTGGGFSSGFSAGFLIATSSTFPQPVGLVSALLIVGDIAYGLLSSGGSQDYPFAFNLLTQTFISVSGVATTNRPNSPPPSGAWTPPTMDVIGSTVLVTHPGFTGTGNFLGTFDISNPSAPVWNAGNIGGTGGFAFDANTRVPVAVKAFNGRAYWAYNPVSGPSATVFSDELAPTTVTNAGTVQIITYDDAVPITALGALPLSNQLGGIVQSLMVFKGVTNIYQVTGDVALGPGPPLGTLARNTLNVATGTFAPNSIASTSKGLAFIAPDGMRVIDFNAQVSDPIGNDGMGKCLPFLYAVVPSRIAAAANGTIYRVSVQDGSISSSPTVEYWYDFSRGAWSGPHTFPASVIKPYRNTFIMGALQAAGSLWQSDYLQGAQSTFVENGTPMGFKWLTCMLPDTDQMSENAMIETTVHLGLAAGASYAVQALNQSSVVLNSVLISSGAAGVLWGEFNWGQADWGGQPSSLYPQPIYWTNPIVFRRLAISVTGPSSQQFRIGTLHLRYEQLGYLQQAA